MKDLDEALAYAQSLFPDREVRPEELYSGVSAYAYARGSDRCQQECPGPEECKIGGIVSRVCCEQGPFGSLVYVVRADSCRNRQNLAAQRKSELLVAASRIPAEMERCTFANYQPKCNGARLAMTLAQGCADQGRGLFLCGPPGVGKTHLAVAIVRRVIELGRSAVFVPVVTLLDELKDAINNGSVQAKLDVLHSADCLVLDDLGMQKDTPWVGERLYEIVNSRYNNQQQLVITSNVRSLVDLEPMIGASGPQIVSRLTEMAMAYCIEAADYRQKKGRRKPLPFKEVV